MVGVTDESPVSRVLRHCRGLVYAAILSAFIPLGVRAILFRTPDGKPWLYHPGSRLQTTFIDLIYARPGSGKSVLSNSINLAVCMSPGI